MRSTLLLLLFAATIMAVVAARPAPTTTRWQYLYTCSCDLPRDPRWDKVPTKKRWHTMLDTLGADGWELTAFSQTNDPLTGATVAVFKRPLP